MGTGGLLGAVELTFRLLPRPAAYPETRSGLVESDPDLLWRLAPRSEGPLATNGANKIVLTPGAKLRKLRLKIIP